MFITKKKFHLTKKPRIPGANKKESNSTHKKKIKSEPLKVGFYKRGTHDVIDCDTCEIQNPIIEIVINAIRNTIHDEKIPVFHPKQGQGILKSVMIRISEVTGQVMIVFSIRGKEFPMWEKMALNIDDAIYEYDERTNSDYYLASINLEKETVIKDNSNKEKSRSHNSRGRNNHRRNKNNYRSKTSYETLAGKPVIRDSVNNMVEYEISGKSFYQVNPSQMVKLYDKAMEYAQVEDANVLDLYCGIGTIGLYAMSKGAKNVVGVESVKEAIVDANRNAVINGVVNARYLCGRAEDVITVENDKYMEMLADMKIEGFDVIFLDPPRAGCDEKLLESIVNIGAKKIVYISCDPGTLARDCKFLASEGYELIEATPVDMFPQTSHVECVVKMIRK